MSKLCKHCGLELRGMEREGDICLQCLASLRPHTTFHEDTFGYSTIEGCIRQSLDIPLTDKEKDDETK